MEDAKKRRLHNVPMPGTTKHTVKKGDSLPKIAQKLCGSTNPVEITAVATAIYKRNKFLIGKTSDPLKPGFPLTIPSKHTISMRTKPKKEREQYLKKCLNEYNTSLYKEKFPFMHAPGLGLTSPPYGTKLQFLQYEDTMRAFLNL